MASSPSGLEHKAREAFIDDHFDLPVFQGHRSLPFQPRTLRRPRSETSPAVADANRAIELDASLHKAYLRKGNARFELEEYQTAKAALEEGAALAPGDTRFANLIKKCEECIDEESGEVLNQTLEKLPIFAVSKDINQAFSEVPKPETLVSNLKPKYRHEFYQKPEEVVLTIFAKGILASGVLVDYGEQILSVTIDSPGEDAYHFQPRLFGKINPEKCRYEVLQTKIEICLAKAEPVNWTSLEFSNTAVPQRVNVISGNAPQIPSYSSKPRSVDWEKLEAQVQKEEKEEKLDGDAALNKFFKDIYEGADEDTRRAMSKSFMESNGTVLSTNWKEVGTKKVEGSPLEGYGGEEMRILNEVGLSGP